MIPRSTIAVAVALVAALAGCALYDRQGTADKLAAQAGLRHSLVRTDPFTLTAYSRIRSPGQPVDVYIEGDGLAWLDVGRVSPDPTPATPVALELAARDSSANVVYLARPCQYTDPRLDPRCSQIYWTDRRFAEEVVAAMGAAIDILKGPNSAAINLVGFSGGGAIATLLAARRSDVASLRTVAGNLDHQAVNRHHQVDQQLGSLNAIDVAARLTKLPQRHFSGSRDDVVPTFIARDFARRAGGGSCVHVTVVDGPSHAAGWSERWPDLLRQPVDCN
jgi:hypothetical protein